MTYTLLNAYVLMQKWLKWSKILLLQYLIILFIICRVSYLWNWLKKGSKWPHVLVAARLAFGFFSKWILGSYKTQTVNFKPMLCKYIHSNMLKTLMFFNIWRKNLKIQKWSSKNYVTLTKIQWKQLQMMGFMMLKKSCSYLIWLWKYLHLKYAEVTKNHLVHYIRSSIYWKFRKVEN